MAATVYHPTAEVERRGWNDVMEGVINEAKDRPEYLQLSGKHYLSPMISDDGRNERGAGRVDEGGDRARLPHRYATRW